MSDLTIDAAKEKVFETINSLSKASQSTDKRLELVESANTDLREALKDLRKATADSQAHVPSGTDREVERAYVQSDTQLRAVDAREIATQPVGIAYGKKTLFGDRDTGVVRLLGGTNDVGDWEPGLLDDPAPKTEAQAELQKAVDDLSLFMATTGKSHAPKLRRRVQRCLENMPGAIGKVFADNSTEGAEFIADITVPVLLRELEAARMLESNFRRVTIGTGGNTTNPFLSTGLQAFIVGTPTSGDLNPAELPKSVPTTASRSVSPTTLSVVLPVNRDAEEDSIIEFGAFGRMLLVEALRDAKEDAIVNGDTAATHGDSGLTSWAGPQSRWSTTGHSADHRAAWIGLRHRALDVSGASADKSGDQTASGLMGWRLNLSAPHGFGNLMYVVSSSFLLAKLLTDSNLLTVDKYGGQATLLTGEVARIGGIPVVISDFMTDDLNTSGIYDGTTTTKTGAILVNRDRFEMAVRREARLEVESRPVLHTNYMVTSWRGAFRTHDGSTSKNLYYGFNLDKT